MSKRPGCRCSVEKEIAMKLRRPSEASRRAAGLSWNAPDLGMRREGILDERKKRTKWGRTLFRSGGESRHTLREHHQWTSPANKHTRLSFGWNSQLKNRQPKRKTYKPLLSHLWLSIFSLKQLIFRFLPQQVIQRNPSCPIDSSRKVSVLDSECLALT